METRDRPVEPLSPAQIEAGESVFGDWKSENWDVIHQDGGLGDVADLLARLRIILSSVDPSRLSEAVPLRSEISELRAVTLRKPEEIVAFYEEQLAFYRSKYDVA